MAIYEGLAGYRVHPNSEPTYIHDVCKMELKVYLGRQNHDDAAVVFKCDSCDKIIGEWLTKDEMNRELLEWFELNAA